jgi:hypothetical protein
MQKLKSLLNRLDINLKKTGKKNDVNYKTPALEDLHNEKMFWKMYSSSAESGIYYLYIICIYMCIYLCIYIYIHK